VTRKNAVVIAIRRIFACVLGSIVAATILVITKLHFETIGRLTSRIAKITEVGQFVRAAPLPSCILPLALIGYCVFALEHHLLGAIVSGSMISLALLCLDVALSEVIAFPPNYKESIALAQQSWVRPLASQLRDDDQIVLVKQILEMMIIAIVYVAIAIALRHTHTWIFLIPGVLIWLRTNAVWQEIIHIDSHMRIFRVRRIGGGPISRSLVTFSNFVSYWGLSQFFGMFPGWYIIEHVGNHHKEINSLEDVETTQRCDRTSFLDFCSLSGHIIANTTTGYGMYGYFFRERKWKYLRMTLIGATSRVVTVALALHLSGPLGVFLLFTSLAFGFSLSIIAICDHGLVDASDPTNIYCNSYNVLWDLDDHAQYGNKNHLSHHLHPAPTWGPRAVELASAQQASLFAAKDALLLRSFAYPDDLLRCYWNDDADFLYNYVASVGARRPNRDEWRLIFAARVRPANTPGPKRHVRFISRMAARLTTSHIPPVETCMTD
jgi:hypothetical protein